MRNFILGGNQAYDSAATDFSKVGAGKLAIFYTDDGEPAVSTTGADIVNEANIVLGRDEKFGGPIVVPIYKNNFSFVKGTYQAGTKFKATLTVPTIADTGVYSVIVALKGKLFNERNKFTSDYYVDKVSTTAATVAEKLAKAVNNNTEGSGIKATVSGAVITFEAVEIGVDYEIIPADNLTGTSVTVVNKGIPAYGDYDYIVDLAYKAAADSGFGYTYDDSYTLYPAYPLFTDTSASASTTGYTIFTLRFAEPRKVRTVDTVVNQIVQIALPTGAGAITTLETIFTGMVEGATTSGASEASSGGSANSGGSTPSTVNLEDTVV